MPESDNVSVNNDNKTFRTWSGGDLSSCVLVRYDLSIDANAYSGF